MVLGRIEKIQKMVNSLLGICAQNGAGEVSQEQDNQALSTEDRKYERLGTLLLKMQDGVLEKRSILRMGKWLSCDACALQSYIDFQSLTALLYEHFNKHRFEKTAEAVKQTVKNAVGPNR